MGHYNKVVLVGNLTRDPELRFSQTGLPVAKMCMAIDRKYRGADNQIKKEVTFIDITSFGKTAETVCKYAKKGQPLMIDGRLHLRRWQTDKGENRRIVDVVTERLCLLPGSGRPSKPRSLPETRELEPQTDEDTDDRSEGDLRTTGLESEGHGASLPF